MSLESIQIDTEKIGSGEKIFNFLDKIGFNEIKKTDKNFNEWINNLSYEDFLDYITRLNGIIREKPLNKRMIDGKGVEISCLMGIIYLPPYAEQKNELMIEGFNAIKEIKSNEDRATLAYYLIQSIHPYSDGNGRTGRLLYELIINNQIDKNTLSEIIDHENSSNYCTGKGRDIFYKKLLPPNKAYYLINREVVKEFLEEDFLKKNGGIYFSAPLGSGWLSEETKNKLSKEEVDLSEKILGEGDTYTFPFRGIVLAKLIEENNSLNKYIYKNDKKIEIGKYLALSEDFGKNILNIDDKIMDDLNEKQVRRLIEIHKELKEKFVKTLIDIFKNPEQHKEESLEGNKSYIKDDFNF